MKQLKHYLSLIPFAYLLYRVYFTFLPHKVQLLAVIGCVFVYLVWNLPKVLKKFHAWRAFLVCSAGMAAIVAFAVAVPLVQGTRDFTYARKLVSEVMELACWLAFACHVGKHATRENVLESFVRSLNQITVGYIGFTVLCIVVPPFKKWWMTLVPLGEAELMNLRYAKYIGRFGWDGFAGYNATFICTVCILLSVLCIERALRRSTPMEKPAIRGYLVYIALLLVGNSFYGRTGLVISYAILAAFAVKETVVRKNIRILLYSAVAAVCWAALTAVIYLCVPSLRPLITWMYEPLFNAFGGAGFSSTSLDSLGEMAEIGSSSDMSLLGDGYYTDPIEGNYYMQVDIGYYRVILFGGILYLVVIVAAVLAVYANIGVWTPLTAALLCVLALLFEYKGEAHCLLIHVGTALAILTPRERPLWRLPKRRAEVNE